ncbi:hypothetical protein BH10BDE1_BH10BDE1_30920 [soil metagenome]
MATTMFDATILGPLFGLIATLVTLAVFDFYAFSPRPSGIAKRSRELAPSLSIALAIGIAALSLHLYSESKMTGLILNGANDAIHTLQAERIRLLSYPLVTTNAFESLILGFTLLASAYFMVTRLGLLGWSLVVLAITLITGVIAVAANPNGINYGPFELTVGLSIASAYAFSRQRVSRRRAKLELVLLASMLFSAAAAAALTDSPLRPELLAAAMLIGVSMTAFLFHLTRIAGPHWEATSLFLVSGFGLFVVAGFILAIAPHIFDREQWRREVVASRAALQVDLINTIRPIEFAADLTPENESVIAKRLEAGATRIRFLSLRAELSPTLEAEDQKTVSELKSLERLILIVEKLHESRALVVDSDRRTSVAAISSTDPSRIDPMEAFWQSHRPWLLSELQKMKDEGHGSQANFIASMEADLDRLTRAAVEVEIHRVDVWVDWAARQPRELVPLLKQTANLQMARLDALAVVTEPIPLRKDARFSSLHQNLRKMASVSESKWE